MRLLPLPCLLALACDVVDPPHDTGIDPLRDDADGDGWAAGGDCDDADPTVHPGAEETCDGRDEDCDGQSDEGWPDVDGDGAAECSLSCPMHVDAAAVGGDGSAEAPFTTIADALTWLPEGCAEILVAPGTYGEAVDFGGRDLALRSTGGAAVTVIDAGGAGSVVTFATGESAAAVLEGFTLRGGSGTWGDGAWFEAHLRHGGGIFVWEASPTILGNVIEDNATSGRGAGAALFRYGGRFEGNVVAGNTVTVQAGYAGAGLYLREADAIVWGNTVRDNAVLAEDGVGGGILARGGSPWIVANRVEGNVAAASGGGIRTEDASAVVAANLVVGNAPEGIVTSNDDRGVVVSNTVVASETDGIKSWTGSGYAGETGPTTSVIDNLSVGNGRYGFYAYGLQALAAFEHNLVFGNARADYAGLEDPTGTFGNVSADPLLDADQRPTTGSPAIDAGTDAAAWGVAVDIEGTARPLGAAWDIGAYEVE